MFPDYKFPGDGEGGDGTIGTLEAVSTLGSATTKTIALKNVMALLIPTTQGLAETPGEVFGNFHVTRDESLLNADGQRDAVLQIGYNQDGTGDNVNSLEAALHLAIESHYIAYPGAPPCMEFHLQSKAKDGAINRHISAQIYKANGSATMFMKWDSIQVFPTNSDTAYFLTGPNGITDIKGPSARLTIENTVVGSAVLRLETYNLGNALFANLGAGQLKINTGTSFEFNDSTGQLFLIDRAATMSLLKTGLTIDGYLLSQGANAGVTIMSRNGDTGFGLYSPSGGHLHFYNGGSKVIWRSEGVSDYADNAAAITAGLAVGSVYRTGDFMKIVH